MSVPTSRADAWERCRTTSRETRWDACGDYERIAKAERDERFGQVCSCGVPWEAHFPVGERGCDFFETREEKAAAYAAEMAS